MKKYKCSFGPKLSDNLIFWTSLVLSIAVFCFLYKSDIPLIGLISYFSTLFVFDYSIYFDSIYWHNAFWNEKLREDYMKRRYKELLCAAKRGEDLSRFSCSDFDKIPFIVDEDVRVEIWR